MEISKADVDLLVKVPVATAPARNAPGAATGGKELPPGNASVAASEEGRQAAREAVEAVNRRLEAEKRSVRLVPDPRADFAVIRVVEPETGRVVRQIPSEQVLKLASWWESNGLLAGGEPLGLAVDERV